MDDGASRLLVQGREFPKAKKKAGIHVEPNQSFKTVQSIFPKSGLCNSLAVQLDATHFQVLSATQHKSFPVINSCWGGVRLNSLAWHIYRRIKLCE